MGLYARSNEILGYQFKVQEAQFRAAVCAEVVRLLREERQSRGLSMNVLAKQTGLSQPTISILESSPPNPKLDSLLRIAGALQLNLGDVVRRAILDVQKRVPAGRGSKGRKRP